MLVVMRQDATADEIREVVTAIEARGLQAHPIPGAQRVAIGITGNKGAVEAPVFDLEAMAPGQVVAGPAVLETATTTVLLHPADRATVTPLGWLDVAVG